ncbi:MAG: hypothetical protein ACE5JJ_10200 [Nitrospinota bacterium]
MPYRALFTITKYLRVLANLGALAALAGGVGGAIFVSGVAQQVVAVVAGLVGAALVWLALRGSAEWIELHLASERFLRQSADHLRTLAARAMVGAEGAR